MFIKFSVLKKTIRGDIYMSEIDTSVLSLFSYVSGKNYILGDENISEFDKLKKKYKVSVLRLYYLNYLFKKSHIECDTLSNIVDVKSPVTAHISCKVEKFGDGNGLRFFLTCYSDDVKYIISNYFDKIVISMAGKSYTWIRNIDSLEVDSLEVVLDPETLFPIRTDIFFYFDLPVKVYEVPLALQDITETHFDTFSNILKSISRYAHENNLVDKGILYTDEKLRSFLNIQQINIEDVSVYLQSVLVKIRPINMNFNFTPEVMIMNADLLIPNYNDLNIAKDDALFNNAGLTKQIKEFLEVKDRNKILTCLSINPIEALEVEIANHAQEVELYDESNHNGPTIDRHPVNISRRCSTFYWQPWSSWNAQKYLDENTRIYERYEKERARQDKKSKKQSSKQANDASQDED